MSKLSELRETLAKLEDAEKSAASLVEQFGDSLEGVELENVRQYVERAGIRVKSILEKVERRFYQDAVKVKP